MKVDVAMCTWNSNKPWFKQCLLSIRREIPVCHFIAVDRLSDDGTVEAIKQLFPEALVIRSNVDLGEARQEAIRYVDTEWFVFVDDDIELCNGWFETVAGHITQDTGAIAGMALPTDALWLQKFAFYAPKMAMELGREWKLEGVVMSNTLIRSNLVRDWMPPRFLSAGEDAHLSQHILGKRHALLPLYQTQVKHYGKWGLFSAKKKMWHYAGRRLGGFSGHTTRRLVRRFYMSPVKGFYAGFRLKDPFIILYLILSDFYNLKGWLQWNKYIIWKR